MTHPAPATPQRREKNTFRIAVTPGSPLDQLMDRREAAQLLLDQAEAAVRDAKAAYGAIEDEIKARTTLAVPDGTERIVITGNAGRPARNLTWHAGGWYVPAEWLRTRHPAVWGEGAREKQGSWRISRDS